MKIRVANLTDLDSLLKLVIGFRGALKRRLPDDETLKGSLKSLLINGESEFFLAIDDSSNVAGYIQQRYRYSLWLSSLEATLEDLYVSPVTRRQGMGTLLVQYAIERAREKGCQAIKLDTNERNLNAINLYSKLGLSSGSSRFSDSRQLLFEKIID